MILALFLIHSFVFGGGIESLKANKTCIDGFCIPRIIWSHWKNDLPEDVAEMINVTRKSLKNFTYCLLTSENISDFLDDKAFPKGYRNVHAAGKADYIRVCLLSKYGGLYIDSTTYINSGKEMENVFIEAASVKAQVFGFYGFGDLFYNITVTFIGAPENSQFVKAFKEEFDIALQGNFKKYINDTCEALLPLKVITKRRCTGYMLVTVVLTKALYYNQSLKDQIYLLPSKIDNQKLAKECNYKKELFQDRLRNDPVVRAYPFIKVNGYLRNGKKFHIGDAEYEANLAAKVQKETKTTTTSKVKKSRTNGNEPPVFDL